MPLAHDHQDDPGRQPLPASMPPPQPLVVPSHFSSSSECLLFVFLYPLVMWMVWGGGDRVQGQPRE